MQGRTERQARGRAADQAGGRTEWTAADLREGRAAGLSAGLATASASVSAKVQAKARSAAFITALCCALLLPLTLFDATAFGQNLELEPPQMPGSSAPVHPAPPLPAPSQQTPIQAAPVHPAPIQPAQIQAAPPPLAPSQPSPSQADPRRTPVVRVVQQAGPAVVSIISAREVKAPFAGESLLPGIFGTPQTQPPKTKTAQNLGSGVIIDGAKGYVLTNAHVITGATQITARLHDGREFTATLQGADQDMDLAVLKLDLAQGAPPLPQARMGDSSELMIGEPVIAIGNPYGLSHTVTTGVVSALERSVNAGQQTIAGLIQTDAAINPGNSGGPLLNILGQVVGINAAVFAKGGGLGFAIPINKAKGVLDELITTGRVAHIWLGLLGENMTPDQAAFYGLTRPGGMVVTDVFPGTPAEIAGIRPGDVLLAMGGHKVRDKSQFLGLLLGTSRGEPLAVLLSRADRQFQVQMRPQVLERQAGLGLITWRWGFTPRTAEVPGPASPTLQPNGAAGFAGVVVASVRGNAPAARLGLKPGDVIMQIGSLRTATEADLLTAFYRYQMHNQLLLSVLRGGQTYTVRMRI